MPTSMSRYQWLLVALLSALLRETAPAVTVVNVS